VTWYLELAVDELGEVELVLPEKVVDELDLERRNRVLERIDVGILGRRAGEELGGVAADQLEHRGRAQEEVLAQLVLQAFFHHAEVLHQSRQVQLE